MKNTPLPYKNADDTAISYMVRTYPYRHARKKEWLLLRCLCSLGGQCNGTFCHNSGHMSTIVLRAMNIRHQFQTISSMACSICNGGLIELLANQCRLHCACSSDLGRSS